MAQMEIEIELTSMAHGGSALGRDAQKRVIFVPQTIPGERVRVAVPAEAKRFANGQLLEVLEPAPSRVVPRCAHFSDQTCSHFQHIDYAAQLAIKQDVVADQLKRIGGLEVDVASFLPSPEIWHTQREVVLMPTAEGGFGYWSAVAQQAIPIEGECFLLHPALQRLIEDFDLALPDLRQMNLRVGCYDDLLVALEVQNVEPPSLEVDFPVSVAIVLPDQTTANLIGDNFVTQRYNGREFQISAGCFMYPNTAVVEQLIDTVLALGRVTSQDVVLELFSGVGVLTAFLAEKAEQVLGIEANSDAVADAAVNLDDTDNVSLYEAFVEDVLPTLSFQPDVLVMDAPSGGLSGEIIGAVAYKRPSRLVYVSDDVATLARDAKRLAQEGYVIRQLQPLDMHPHTFHHTLVVLFEPA